MSVWRIIPDCPIQPNLPDLPRQLKTHIAFSMFPILDTNLCFLQLPGQYSADVSVEEEVGNYLTAEVPSGSGRRGSFRGSRISSVGHSHSGSMDLMETGSLPSGFR